MQIFVLEDDAAIAMGLTYALQQEGYGTTHCKTVQEALKTIEQESFSLYILDLTLPDGSGYDVCKAIKKKGDLPVIFLTAYDEEVNVIMGFEMGADDYISKPFGIMEFVSRVKALLRRAAPKEELETITFGNITIDDTKRTVTADGNLCELTYKEFELLKFLMLNQGIVLSREKLLSKVWGFEFDGETRTVDMHIKTLRQKLGTCGTCIKTVRNVGYKLDA